MESKFDLSRTFLDTDEPPFLLPFLFQHCGVELLLEVSKDTAIYFEKECDVNGVMTKINNLRSAVASLSSVMK